MKFKIEKSVFDKFPNLVIALPVITDFDNTKSAPEALKFLRETEEELKKNLTLEKFWQDPRVTAYLDCFKAFGVDPEKFRPAHVALTKRVLEGGQLPDINPMVNLYNAISIKYLTPFGGENLNAIYGDFVLKFANGGEEWIPIGGDKSKPAVKGELVWGDDLDLSTRALNWRQCDRTKMTLETKNGYFVMDGFSNINKDNIKKAAEEFVNEAVKLFGGEAKIYWLDSNNPEIEISFVSKREKERQDAPSLCKQSNDGTANLQYKKVEKSNKVYYQVGTLSYDLASQIFTTVKTVFPDINLQLEDIVLEHPTVEEYGDYSTNVALRFKLDPHQILAHLPEGWTVRGRFLNYKFSQPQLVTARC
ncbi:hypothetical protein HY310_00830 [Candidatus Microgenomates bacterium]|nr:hypothetical protein [Candidatus Microgenomates bacterium]